MTRAVMAPIKIISKFIVLILCSLYHLVFRILIALQFEYMNRVNTTASVLELEEVTVPRVLHFINNETKTQRR